MMKIFCSKENITKHYNCFSSLFQLKRNFHRGITTNILKSEMDQPDPADVLKAVKDLPTSGESPYAIKNQRKSRNAPSRGHFVPKPLVGGFGCLELVLYGIRELA